MEGERVGGRASRMQGGWGERGWEAGRVGCREGGGREGGRQGE